MTQLVHYVLVRRDMPTGVATAQIVHAAGESYMWWTLNNKPYTGPTGTIAVVLGVRNEKQLKYYMSRLLKAGICRFIPITENAGALKGQITAIGLEPTCERAKVFKVLKKLQPLREFEG